MRIVIDMGTTISTNRTAAILRAEAREADARRRHPAPPVNGPDRGTWDAEVRDDVISLGPHWEDGEERFQTVYTVSLVNAYGERYTYRWDFPVLAWAERLADLAQAATRAGRPGDRRDPRRCPAKWARARPVYGSLAYEHGVGGGDSETLLWELDAD